MVKRVETMTRAGLCFAGLVLLVAALRAGGSNVQ